MDFFELVGQRHSVREFQQKGVEQEKLRKILEAAQQAPSAGNLQAYRIIVVKASEKREQLGAAALGQSFVAAAPVVLVFFADLKRSAGRYSERGRLLYAVQDATIACTYAQLAAQQLGLSSVWVGAFDDDAVSKAVNAPGHFRPVAILPIGYAAEQPFITRRRSVEDLVAEEGF